jgi:hypothetical protein
VTSTAVTPRPEFRVGTSCVDVTFPTGLVITGNKLVALCARLKHAGFQTSLGTGETREPHSFTLRLHGATADDIVKLEELDVFATFDFNPSYDPAKQPEVLFVYEGIAHIAPDQPLAVGSLLAVANRLAERFKSKVRVGMLTEFLAITVAHIQWEYNDDHGVDAKLADEVGSKYALVASLQCNSDRKGVILKDGRCFVASVLNGKNLDLDFEALNGVPEILSTPAPEVKFNDYQPHIYIWTSLPLDTPAVVLYEHAAKVFLRLGIYPLGDFIVFDSDREHRVYNPPALTA